MNPFLVQENCGLVCSDSVTETGSVFVKGLFSTDLVDREADFVDPLEFNLNVFANTATLLRNHEFILDENGNKETAGKVVKTVPVKILQENPDNPTEWILKSLISEDIVGVWPKHKSPNLLKDDRGVYIVAEVTHEKVIKQVLKGELGAFSWTGLTRPIKRENGLTELTSVDLLEVSLVNIPANPDATFVITDKNDPSLDLEVNLKDCDIYQIRFDKNEQSLANIKEYTKSLNTNTESISENDSHYFVQVGDAGLVDAVNSFPVSSGKWTFIAAPKIEKKKTEVPRIGKINSNIISENNMSEDIKAESEVIEEKVEAEKFYMLDEKAFTKLVPDAVVTLQKSTVLGELPVDIHFIEFPTSPVEVKEEETVLEEVKEEVVLEETPSEVSDETSKKIDALTELVASLATTIAAKEAKEQEEALAAKTADEIKEEAVKEIESKMEAFKKDQESLEAQRTELQKSLDRINAFESAVSDKTERAEKVESSKSRDIQEAELSSVDYFANLIMKGVN